MKRLEGIIAIKLKGETDISALTIVTEQKRTKYRHKADVNTLTTPAAAIYNNAITQLEDAIVGVQCNIMSISCLYNELITDVMLPTVNTEKVLIKFRSHICITVRHLSLYVVAIVGP